MAAADVSPPSPFSPPSPVVPHDGEPEASPWRAVPLADVAAMLLERAGTPQGRPPVVAVDGRSAGGKSTVADRIAAVVPGAAVVHTDDVAWWESFFGWDPLMIDGVLRPVHAGRGVAFRPPAWDVRGREGAIEVPADATLLVVEGVGASRASLAPYIDAAVWVQSDAREARRRGIERDGGASAVEFWDQWQAEEVPFLAAGRPWERADLVLCGTPDLLVSAGLLDPAGPGQTVVVGRLLG